MEKILLIIPAFNEEESIERVISGIQESNYDYIIINDGSSDATKSICEKHKYNVINLPINLGIGGAVQTGYKYAVNHGYSYAFQLDSDGQHDPEFLSLMINNMEETGADMVIGSRFIENKGFRSSTLRRLGIRFLSWLIKMMTGQRIMDPTSGLRLSGRKALEVFARDYPRDYAEPETEVMLLKRGMKIVEIPVIMHAKQGGNSSISIKKSIYYMVKVTLSIILVASKKNV